MAGVLFLGNGINQAFGGDSWEALVKKFMDDFDCKLSYNEIKCLPFPMQIVAVSGDNVDAAMKALSYDMNFIITDEQKDFLKTILALPLDNIITTNYTFELEQASGTKPSNYGYRKLREYTKPCKGKESKFSLFKYYSADDSKKKIWHIHGDITVPSTVIMGTYYYGKLLSEIQTYVPHFIKRYKIAQREVGEYAEQSWVDSFLSKNVYVTGFGLDTSEIDIWWLLGCKKRNFPDTKVFLYEPKFNGISAAKVALLKAYGVEIIDYIPFSNDDYKAYYQNAIADINKKIITGDVSE